METTLPIEEMANQRLKVLVNAYTLFIKNLKAEGVAPEKVKAASDKTWQVLGQAAGEQFKALAAGAAVTDVLFDAGTIAASVHGMQFEEERGETEKRVKIEKCPWHEASQAFDLPGDWRFCQSGHTAFSNAMLQTISPEASAEITQSLVEGAPFCDERVGI